MKKVILIPSYEPDDNLIYLVKKIHNEKKYEIVVVNDGSSNLYDNIFIEVENYAKVISYKNNKGKGFAIKKAIKYIKDKYKKNYLILTMDSDGQHTLKDAKKLIEYTENNPNDLALGKRLRDKKIPLRSKFGNEITRFIYFISTGVKVYDTQTGLRCFTDKLVDFLLSIEGDRFEYEMNVLLMCPKKKIKIHEIVIETIYINNNSKSHFNKFKDSWIIYKNIFKKIFSIKK